MKTNKWLACLLIILGLTLINPAITQGAEFCVTTTGELQAALTTAVSNGQDDTIKIVQGTYNGNFIYASTEAYGVTIEGGYTGACSSRAVNPANTVLDAGGSGTGLVLSSPNVAPNFGVEGITLQNGNITGKNGGGVLLDLPGDRRLLRAIELLIIQ